MKGYDTWKTNDPNDDGSHEIKEALEEQIAGDDDKMDTINREILLKYTSSDDDTELVRVLANVSYAVILLAKGVPIDKLSQDSLARLRELMDLSEQIAEAQSEAIKKQAQYEYDNPPGDD